MSLPRLYFFQTHISPISWAGQRQVLKNSLTHRFLDTSFILNKPVFEVGFYTLQDPHLTHSNKCLPSVPVPSQSSTTGRPEGHQMNIPPGGKPSSNTVGQILPSRFQALHLPWAWNIRLGLQSFWRTLTRGFFFFFFKSTLCNPTLSLILSWRK